jgi:sporulation protein YlmC with PRC-barrel domain
MKALKVVLLALVVTTAAQAQADSTAVKQEPPPIAGGAVLGVEVKEMAIIATGHRVSKLIGEAVYNDKNEKIGKIDDFIFRPDGSLTYAIIEVGGFLKIGTHRVAIPVSQFSGIKPHVVLPGATKDALKAMPEFVYAKGQ